MKLAILFALSLGAANACSFVKCDPTGQEFQSSFAVKVLFKERPIAGATVDIALAESEIVASATTDANGIARFDLAPGRYSISAWVLGLYIPQDCFHISKTPSNEAKTEVTYSIEGRPFSTRSASGIVKDMIPSKGIFAGARLAIANVFTRESYTTTSNENGEYRFPALPAGSYSLRIDVSRDGWRHGGVLAVEIDSRSPNRALNLAHGETSCGDAWFGF